MTMTPIGADGSNATQQVHRHHHGNSPFEAVSQLFSMSAKDIAKEVRSGKSLDDIAREKGISHTDLISALKAGAPSAAKSDPDFDANIEKLSTAKGMPGRAGRVGGDHDGDNDGGKGASGVVTGNLNAAQQSALKALSSLLGTSSADLVSQLQNGKNLTSMLAEKGVTLDQVGTALQTGFLLDAKL